MENMNNKSNIQFVNCCKHDITLNDGRVFKPSGAIAEVSMETSEPVDGIAIQRFGKITGLPEPKENTFYICSALVAERAAVEGRNDVVSPATRHPLAVRNEKQQVVSVPFFLRIA